MSNHPGKPLYLDQDEVETNLPLPELIDAIEKCFVQYSQKVSGITQPQRLFMPVGEDEEGKFFLVKPACSLPDNTLCTKLLTLYPNNEQQHQLPALQSVLTIFNATTGSLEAVLDGIAVTDLRTAAATVVAVKHLTPRVEGVVERKVLTIIGGGHQAVSHIKLFRQISDWFSETRVFIRSSHKRTDFSNKWNVDTSFESVEDAVRGADIIVTCTSSKTAVLYHKWVKPTSLVVLVGAPEPTSREVDDDMMLKGHVFTDSMEAAQHGGDVRLSRCVVVGEVGLS